MRYAVKWAGSEQVLTRLWLAHPITGKVARKWCFIVGTLHDGEQFLSEERARLAFEESGFGFAKYVEILPVPPMEETRVALSAAMGAGEHEHLW